MVHFLGQDTANNAVKLQVGDKIIMIWRDSNLTGLISLRDKDGKSMWQKVNCTAKDLAFAILLAENNVYTDVFETD